MTKIVIIGAGFAGLSVLRRLLAFRRKFHLCLIDKKPTFDLIACGKTPGFTGWG